MHRPSLVVTSLAVFFLVSGFCSLVYQVVWLRLAMAQFGVTAQLTAIVLSVFMGGLALGSVVAGRLAARAGSRPAVLLFAYGLCELAIGAGATLVPAILSLGRGALLAQGEELAWGSHAHYAMAALWVVLALLPFCACMGATVPLAMGVVRALRPAAAARSFSALYAANVLGAALGTLVCAFVLIELYGFMRTLRLTSTLNFALGAAAMLLALALRQGRSPAQPGGPGGEPAAGTGEASRFALVALLVSGVVSMASELVWIRLFTPMLGNLVYSFALLLAVYLLANFAGSCVYRVHAARSGAATRSRWWLAMWVLLCVGVQLALVVGDPRMQDVVWSRSLEATVLAIGAFCFATGYLTPLLVEHWSRGEPRRAGNAYALNALGCIAGPLLAGFCLLPSVGERATIALLGGLCLAMAAGALAGPLRKLPATTVAYPRAIVGALAVLCLAIPALTRDFDSQFAAREVRRDFAATTIATGAGMQRRLLVNGIGMTVLTTRTKLMADLPLAFLAREPRSVLVICFGMGTTFRTALSWGAEVTAVELVPGVVELFGYFHDDAETVLRKTGAHAVIDDGRRLLERSPQRYDVIVLDPPPPSNAADSSLLYSVEFYRLARRRLAPDGILQQWVPGSDLATLAAVAQAIGASFPHVRVFRPLGIMGGMHFLASAEPIPRRTVQELAQRLPEAAARDLLEWEPTRSVESLFGEMLANESRIEVLEKLVPGIGPVTDDNPINEYDFLRSQNEQGNAPWTVIAPLRYGSPSPPARPR